MIHRYHPDPAQHDDSESILYDDCERCEQHAEQLVGLDRGNVGELWRRMLVWTGRVPGRAVSHTRNEIAVMRQFERMALILDNLGGKPETLPDSVAYALDLAALYDAAAKLDG